MSKKLKPRDTDERFEKSMSKFTEPITEELLESVETTVGTINFIPLSDDNFIESKEAPDIGLQEDIKFEKIDNNSDLEDNKALNIEEQTLDNADNFHYEELTIHSMYAAPENWNLWSKHSGVKMVELMESIKEIGLQQNVVVWKIPDRIKESYGIDKGYMILAGHNRVEALRKLYFIYKESRFFTVHTKVYKSESLTEGFAKKIIDDTNLLARDKTTQEITDAYVRRMINLKEKEEYQGVSERTLQEIIAQEEGKSRSHVYRYLKLKDLISPLAETVGREINMKAAINLSSLDEEQQYFIYETYILNESKKHLYNSSNMSKLRPEMTRKTMESIFETRKKQFVTLSFEVEVDLKDEFEKYVKKFIKANNTN